MMSAFLPPRVTGMRAVKPVRILVSFTAIAMLSLTACSDSTGPSTDAEGALQSLSLAIGGMAGTDGPITATMVGSLSKLAPFIDQVQVVVAGKSYTMNALGIRESFPEGTCFETIFVTPGFPPPAGSCTPLPPATVLLFWQSRSRNSPPDRMLIVSGSDGTSDFGFDVSSSLPELSDSFALALYSEGTGKGAISTAGRLTMHVSAGSQSCDLPLPPYAKSATCSISSFAAQADATMEEFDGLSDSGTTKTLSLSIPQQTVHGVWEAITETKPFVLTGVPYQRSTPVTLSR
jgi:hypothetical protein